jgi:hypothetical protein
MAHFLSAETGNEVHNGKNINHRVIGNTTFKVVSYYSDKRTYEDIVKNAILREIKREI